MNARVGRLARQAFAADWRLILLDLALIVLNSARPGLAAYLTARFVNALIVGHGVLPWVGGWIALQVMEDLTNNFGNGLVQGRLHQCALLRIRDRVLKRAAEVPLIRLQDPDFQDRLARASGELGDLLGRWMRTAMWMLNAALSTIGAVVALLALGVGPWLPAALIASAAVSVWVGRRLGLVDLRRSRDAARPGRLAGAWSGLLSARAAAPEVRLFGVGAQVKERWARAYREAAGVDLHAAGARLRWGAVEVAAALAAQAVMLALAAAAAVAAGPARGAGVFAGVWLGAVMVQGYFGAVVGAAGGLTRHARVLEDLAEVLFEEDPALQGPNQGLKPAAATAGAIAPEVVAEGVTFRYPAAPVDALRGVTARIAPGEVVALVGPNGAGKSTLAGVLLGLYTPSAGRLAVGSGPSPVRGGAVFQDFARYSLTVRDNVGFGDLPAWSDDATLRAALRHAGSGLEESLDDWLGPEFGGRALSGGEWLRVAIARGVVGRRAFVVLDEPTAAIDPLAEVDLVRRLLHLGQDRTALVVSHRLGLARMADRILVMDQGRVVEDGTHADLVAAGAEDLPLASGTADLVVGALFLHFTEPAEALREMARVVRAGGRLAICAGRAFPWPRPWAEVLEPVRQELASLGLPFRHHLLEQRALLDLIASAGLKVERASETGPERWEFPSADLAVASWRQLGLISLLLKGVSETRRAVVQEEFEHRLLADFMRYRGEDWTIHGFWDNVVAAKPK